MSEQQITPLSTSTIERLPVPSTSSACGPVPAEANSVQFDGSGTFNGESASFRVCVQDNHQGNKGGPDNFHLVCTSGCNYSAGGAINGGNLQVRQN